MCTDSASLYISLESLKQWTSFCISCTLAMSSLIVLDFRSIFLSRTHRPVTHELSSILSFHECSCNENQEVLVLDLPVLREVDLDLAWTVQHNFQCFGLYWFFFNARKFLSARSALYSCLRISNVASASNRSFCVSRWFLISSSSNSWLDFRFCDDHVTGLPVRATTFFIRATSLPQMRSFFLLLNSQGFRILLLRAIVPLVFPK